MSWEKLNDTHFRNHIHDEHGNLLVEIDVMRESPGMWAIAVSMPSYYDTHSGDADSIKHTAMGIVKEMAKGLKDGLEAKDE